MKHLAFPRLAEYLLFATAAVFTVASFSACETQENYTRNSSRIDNTKIERKSFDEVMNDATFSRGFAKYKRLLQNGSLVAKDEDGEYHRIEIDSNLVKIVSTLNEMSYNFLVNKYISEINKTENLILQLRDPGTAQEELKAYLVKYNLAASPSSPDYMKVYNVLADNKIAAWTDCVTIVIYEDHPCTCANHMPGDNCNCENPPYTTSESFTFCDSASGGGDGGSGGNGGNGGTTGGGTTGGGTTGPGTGGGGSGGSANGGTIGVIHVAPIFFDDPITVNLYNSLSSDQNHWLDHHVDVSNFITTNVVNHTMDVDTAVWAVDFFIFKIIMEIRKLS